MTEQNQVPPGASTDEPKAPAYLVGVAFGLAFLLLLAFLPATGKSDASFALWDALKGPCQVGAFAATGLAGVGFVLSLMNRQHRVIIGAAGTLLTCVWCAVLWSGGDQRRDLFKVSPQRLGGQGAGPTNSAVAPPTRQTPEGQKTGSRLRRRGPACDLRGVGTALRGDGSEHESLPRQRP